ncbi:MAG: NADH-quinone oxidoreductase subunit A [Candidatus Aminicenantes bacterium]
MIDVFLVFLVAGILGTILILINKITGPKKSSPVKDTPFECGSPYLQDRIYPISIQFYLVAFLFLLFDVELVFFFPWALVFKSLGGPAVISMAVYIFILAAGFIYAWKKGAFRWER